MRSWLSILCVLWLCTPAHAVQPRAVDDISRMLTAARDVEIEDEPLALIRFERVLAREPANHEALWRASLLAAKIGNRSEGAQQEALFEKARGYAERALAADADHPESHFVMAVAMGRAAEVASVTERVAAARSIKHHLDETLRRQPRHAGAWYVMGKLYFRVANLSAVERMAARTIFGLDHAGATNADAIRAFKRAVELKPHQVLYRHDLARAYLADGNRDAAMRVLHRAVGMRAVAVDDRIALRQCKRLLRTLRASK